MFIIALVFVVVVVVAVAVVVVAKAAHVRRLCSDGFDNVSRLVRNAANKFVRT